MKKATFSIFLLLFVVLAQAQTIEIEGSDTVCRDESVTFIGQLPDGAFEDPVYQWQKSSDQISWGNLPGATEGQFSISHVNDNDQAYYRFVVKEKDDPSSPEDAAEGVFLSVTPPINITSAPSNLTICEADEASFSVSASGSSLNYQWQRKDGEEDWKDLSGETATTLKVTDVGATENGSRFRVRVSNDCEEVFSGAGALTVTPAVKIETHPKNQALCQQGDVSFRVQATGSHLSYQWQSSEDGGGHWEDLVEETKEVIDLSDMGVAEDGHLFRVLVMGDCGEEWSQAAKLSIDAPFDILSDPLDQIECQGGEASFQVQTEGTHLKYQWYSSADQGGAWQKLTGKTSKTLKLTNLPLEDNENWYRVVVSNGCGEKTSEPAVLQVVSGLEIDEIPQNQTLCEGGDASFEVQGNLSNLTYQWRSSSDGGLNWEDIPGATSTKLNLENVDLSQNGMQVYALVNSDCANISSPIATLKVEPNLKIEREPEDQVTCEGGNAIFSPEVKGAGLHYQWFSSSDKGASWVEIPDAQSRTLSLHEVDLSQDGNRYRLEIESNCGKTTSQPASLSIKSNLKMIEDLEDQTTCVGGDVDFHVEVEGSDINYQWFSSIDHGISWQEVQDVTGADLQLNGVQKQADGTLYYVSINSSCGSEMSAMVTLNVTSEITITEDPQDQVICEGDNTSLEVKVSGSGLKYQWQRSVNNGQNWENVAEATEAELHLSELGEEEDGYLYRVEINSNCGTTLSEVARVNVSGRIAIIDDLEDEIACVNGTADFSINASGTSLDYQWMVSTDGGDSWEEVANEHESTLSLSELTLEDDGNQYYVDIRTDCGFIRSRVVDLQVSDEITIRQSPTDQAVCERGDVTFEVEADGGHLSYQWEQSIDGGNQWEDIAGATETTYTVTDASSDIDGSRYRVQIKNECESKVSDEAQLIIDPQTMIDQEPKNRKACEAATALFSVEASGSDLSYQWFSSTDRGANWTEIAGATVPDLEVPNVRHEDSGTIYYVRVYGACSSENSETVRLDVAPDLNFVEQPEDLDIWEHHSAYFSVNVKGNNLHYQWQSSDDGGSNWSDIPGENYNTLSLLDNPAAADGTQYRVIVSNDCDQMISDPATLTVDVPTEPSRCEGGNISFLATTSQEDISYQWQVSKDQGANWQYLLGETDDKIELQNVENSQDGDQYRAEITRTNGIGSSEVFTLHVIPKPTIDKELRDQIVCEGGKAAFEVEASGVNLTYQWQTSTDGSQWSDIEEGGNFPTYTLPEVEGDKNGNLYRVIVEGDCGEITSNVATLQVDVDIHLTQEPEDLALCQGEDATFEVETNNTAVDFQWFVSVDGGTRWEEIEGATTSSFHLHGVTLADDGNEYYVLVSGACDEAVSKVAKLRVNKKAVISTPPEDQTVCENSDVSFKVKASGYHLSYQWQALEEGEDTWQDIADGTHSTLELTGVLSSQNNTQYRVVIENGCDAPMISSPAVLKINPNIPITVEPQDQIVCEGSPAAFEVETEGDDLSFQWWTSEDNGNTWLEIPGAQQPRYEIPEVESGDNDNEYFVLVRSSCWSVSSRIAKVFVQEAGSIIQQPEDEELCEGGKTTFKVETKGKGLLYQWQVLEERATNWEDIPDETEKELSLEQVKLSQNNNQYRVVVTKECVDEISDPALLSVLQQVQIEQPESQEICEGEDVLFDLNAQGAGLEISWMVSKDKGGSWSPVPDGDQSVLELNEVNQSENGNRYYAVVDGNCKIMTSEVADLTVHPVNTITKQPQDNEVCSGGSVTFSVSTSSANQQFQWESSEDEGVNWSPIADALSTSLRLTNLQRSDSGRLYRLVIGNDCGKEISEVVHLSVNPQVEILKEPEKEIVCEGDVASFEVEVQGSNMTYQWLSSADGGVSWKNIDQATSSELQLDNVSLEDNGKRFYVIAHGDCGTVISKAAKLQVNPQMQLTASPENQEVCEKEEVTFSVKASGVHLTYQWQESEDGQQWADLSGETASELSFSAAPADSGLWYRAVVEDDCKSEASASAQLAVNSAVTILESPQDQAVCEGGGGTFEIKSSGTGLTYQWQSSKDEGENWQEVPAATQPILELSSLQLDEDGTQYRVVVEGICGAKTSSPARLDVLETTKIVSQPQSDTVCLRSAAIFEVKAVGDHLTYQWQSLESDQQWTNLSGENNATLELTDMDESQDGRRFRVIIDGSCGETISEEVDLTVLPEIKILTQPEEQTVCATSDVPFSVTASGPHLSYQWQSSQGGPSGWKNIPSGGTEAEIELENVNTSQDGTLLRVLVSNNCETVVSDSVRLNVQENILPSVRIVSGDAKICEGDEIQLFAVGQNVDDFVWQDGTMGNTFMATEAGKYKVEVSNLCGTTEAEVDLTAGINCATDVVIPNAFTPNSDGLNDVFRPVIHHRLSDYQFLIYDRWGNLVFSTEEWNAGWDGTIKGKNAPTGAYVWYLRYRTSSDAQRVLKKGSVTLIR